MDRSSYTYFNEGLSLLMLSHRLPLHGTVPSRYPKIMLVNEISVSILSRGTTKILKTLYNQKDYTQRRLPVKYIQLKFSFGTDCQEIVYLQLIEYSLYN